jgi:hypothetical protein
LAGREGKVEKAGAERRRAEKRRKGRSGEEWGREQKRSGAGRVKG